MGRLIATFFFTLIPVVLTLTFCGCNSSPKAEMVQELIDEARQQLAPEKRIRVFNIHGKIADHQLILTGDIHCAELKHQLIEFLKARIARPIQDHICILPDQALGGKTFGVVCVSVANIRATPNHPAELCTQALLGNPLQILKKQKDWFLVETPDHYLGWTDDRIALMTKAEYDHWIGLPKIIVTSRVGTSYEKPDTSAEPVSDVVLGTMLAFKSHSKGYYQVVYPDGRIAYLKSETAQQLSSWLKSLHPTPEKIVRTAHLFTGIPYLWGGISTKGLDCSGFTKTVFYLNGLLLPRDADQQAVTGIPVEPHSDWSGLAAGDLLFFKSSDSTIQPPKVTHVALSLGKGRFIHADQDVHINSLDPKDPEFSQPRQQNFLWARRILGAPASHEILKVTEMPFFIGHAN
jgi:gamma-D-glutamyl-L-lysine dipeptidyl-peptidase